MMFTLILKVKWFIAKEISKSELVAINVRSPQPFCSLLFDKNKVEFYVFLWSMKENPLESNLLFPLPLNHSEKEFTIPF